MLRYFLEYQWFVDFAVYSTLVYLFTEGYYCFVDPQKEVNIGILWCLLTIFFSVYPSPPAWAVEPGPAGGLSQRMPGPGGKGRKAQWVPFPSGLRCPSVALDKSPLQKGRRLPAPQGRVCTNPHVPVQGLGPP